MQNSVKIERINTYNDERFSKIALLQHGCFVVNDSETYEFEITSISSAIVRYSNSGLFLESVAEEFRFYAGFIYKFYDDLGSLVFETKMPDLIDIEIEAIQPSQFFVSQEKLDAIKSCLRSIDDIVIPVFFNSGKLVSVDGHTRMLFAYLDGTKILKGMLVDYDAITMKFADEAIKRDIHNVRDLKILSPEKYNEEWNGFCDYFLKHLDNE